MRYQVRCYKSASQVRVVSGIVKPNRSLPSSFVLGLICGFPTARASIDDGLLANHKFFAVSKKFLRSSKCLSSKFFQSSLPWDYCFSELIP